MAAECGTFETKGVLIMKFGVATLVLSTWLWTAGPGLAAPGDSTRPTALRMDSVLSGVDRRLVARRGRAVLPVTLAATRRTSPKTLSPYFYVPGVSPRGTETLPLKSTAATVSIAGVMARVQVKQTYKNTGRKAIEAIYVFAGSTRAAVHGMRMKIGKRVVEAKITERHRARQIYNRARHRGQRASLLSAHRANVFTMRVANIMPGDTITVELDYSELLVPEDGTYSFVYPTVVGPRYGGGANGRPSHATSIPTVRSGGKNPYPLGLEVHLRTPLDLKMVKSPSHKVRVRYESKRAARIRLLSTSGENRDFVLRYRLASGKIQTGVMTYRQGGEQFFLMMMEPPRRVSPAQIPRREYIFVLDVSGSMSGFPLNTAKALIQKLLGNLRATDYFNVVLFAGASVVMAPRSLPVNPANIRHAQRVIARQRGGGGTELLAALRKAHAISPIANRGVSRSVVVITDGYVGVEAETLRFIRKNLSAANCFAFGIGSSVNRSLIEGMSRAGMGAPFVVLSRGQAPQMADRFRRYIQQPVLTDIRLTFSSPNIYDVVPRHPPDLLARRPLMVLGKYRGKTAPKILVSGTTGTGVFKKTLDLAQPGATGSAHKPLGVLWARKWAERLMDQLAMLPRDRALIQAVTNLGLTYNLLTRFTSLVAVDSRVVNRTGKVVGVNQPLPLPSGISDGVMSTTPGRYRAPRRPEPVGRPSPSPGSATGGGGAAPESYKRSAPCSIQRRIGGCQCQSNGGSPTPLLLLLLPLALWLVQRRRTPKA
jgi:Ca-activated chloride channel homolog